jgi:hypothetical protein
VKSPVYVSQRYNRGVDPSDRLIPGLFWCLGGVVWLYRATRQEANPNTPVTLFTKPEAQPDKEKRGKIWAGVLYLIVGGIWILSGIFSRH